MPVRRAVLPRLDSTGPLRPRRKRRPWLPPYCVRCTVRPVSPGADVAAVSPVPAQIWQCAPFGVWRARGGVIGNLGSDVAFSHFQRLPSAQRRKLPRHVIRQRVAVCAEVLALVPASSPGTTWRNAILSIASPGTTCSADRAHCTDSSEPRIRRFRSSARLATSLNAASFAAKSETFAERSA